MTILNIAGYQFSALSEIPSWREKFLAECQKLSLKGTILLSPEGINVSLAGDILNVQTFLGFLGEQKLFQKMTFRKSYSDFLPFKRLKVKVKKEIITFRQEDIHPDAQKAPSISPEELKQWLDEKRDVLLLDTRNTYEIEKGSFQNATHLGIEDFVDFPKYISDLPKDKPIVMFCTGGIRCEK